MQVGVRQSSLQEADAALVAVGLFEGDSPAAELAEAPGAADAKGSFKTLTRLYPGAPDRVLAVGLGEREDFTVEKLRVAAALVAAEAGELGGGPPGRSSPARSSAPTASTASRAVARMTTSRRRASRR